MLSETGPRLTVPVSAPLASELFRVASFTPSGMVLSDGEQADPKRPRVQQTV